MKSARRLVGVLSVVVCGFIPAVALAAAPDGPVRLAAAAQGQVIDAPGTDVRAEVVTFGEALAPALLRVAPEETVRVAGWPVAPGVRADVRLTRFEIYAPDARIWKVEGDRRTEVPRSRMAFFQGFAEDTPDTRVFAGLDPDTGAFQGLAISPQGSFEIRPFGNAGRRHLVTVPGYFLPENGKAEPLSWTCSQSEAEMPLNFPQETGAAAGMPGESLAGRVLSSLHTVTVAVDTDNELMLLKFSDNTANATSYVAALIAAMNVIYERDLNIRLLQGDLNLRVSSTADPYVQVPDSNPLSASYAVVTSAQLNEFTNYWSGNNGGITRGLAMMLSGKSPANNISSGLAWVTGLCSPSLGYSFSQVFKYAGSTGASDAFVVGHELGHNFGSPHTHNPSGYSPPIDTCATTSNAGLFNCITQCGAQCPLRASDGALACNACPAETTINGVTTRGTLMSYCRNISCTTQEVFHPRTIDLITSVITPQIGVCVFPAITPPTLSLANPNHGLASGGTAVTLTGTGFQNGATVSFGGTAAASVTFNNSTQLSVVTPAHAAGTVNVVVTNPDTGTVTGTNAFTFDPLPTITALSPNNGTTAGGTSVTINGANFQSGATVTWGGSPVAAAFVDSTRLTLTTPAHATGAVSVSVTNPDTGAVTKTNAFFYAPPPVATDLYTLTPCRVLDTRNPDSPSGGPVLGPGGERSFPVVGSCGVPAGAVAAVLNVTALTPTALGNLSVFPGNAFALGTSILNFTAGKVVANNATILLATDGTGTIRILNGSSGTTHVVVDVTGYYAE